MNRSWNRNSSNSPGFVYFNQDLQNETGTTDFIPFQDSSTQNYQHSPNYGSPKFHSSPRKYNNRNNFRHSGGNRGNRSFYSPNCSNTSWHDQKQYKQHYRKKKPLFNNSMMMSADGKRDMSLFYDFTCTSNPWEGLEQKIESNDTVENLEEIKIELDDNKTAITDSSKKESSSSDEESSSTEDSSLSNQEYEQEET